MAEVTINDLIANAEGPIHLTLSKELSVALNLPVARMVCTLRLEIDGPTERSKRRPLCPPIMVSSHGEGLRMLAEVFDQLDAS